MRMCRVNGMVLGRHEHGPYIYAIKRREALIAVDVLEWIVVLALFWQNRGVVVGGLSSKYSKRRVPEIDKRKPTSTYNVRGIINGLQRVLSIDNPVATD